MEKEAIHPGEFLADELIEIKISPTELSRQIDVPANRISQIIRGKRDITADTALRLGKFFGTGPELWMNLQKAYHPDAALRQPKTSTTTRIRVCGYPRPDPNQAARWGWHTLPAVPPLPARRHCRRTMPGSA